MRILVVGDPYCPSGSLRNALEPLSGDHELTFADVVDEPPWTPTSDSGRRLRETMGTPEQVIAALDGHDVLVVQGAPVTDAVLDADPGLRLVCCARGGPVNVDVDAASARGVPVVITPGKNADAVAELTMAFVVMLLRRVPEVLRHVEAGGAFGHDNYEGAHWFGHDAAGRILGLVGFGQIGQRVAARAIAFGMRVVAADPFVDDEVIRDAGVEPLELQALLETADIVSLHARATAENRGLIGAPQVDRMRPGAYLINTARDSLVDETAVGAALASGRLAGAAFDVISPSPSAGRHPLLAYPNVVVTTHIGGATYETLAHGAEMAAQEIRRLASGQPLLNLVNRAALGDRSTGSAA
jgi:D-3-phosphoglycerate dehydrogenase / 2-oxoglutarate reductase